MNQRSSPFAAMLGVIALALCAYGVALAGEYVFDDVHSVAANPALADLGNLWRYWTDPSAFSGSASRMYRPALLTSFALNIAVSPAAWSLKAGNVLLHGLVAGLAFLWIWRLSRRARFSFAAAALFAVHPLASEAVNLVSARSELLLVMGLLLALHGHLSWQRGGGGARGAFACIVAGAVLACGSKETGVVLPALLVVQTLCLRHRLPVRAEWRRAALAVLPVVAVVVVYLVARKLLLGQATVQLFDRSGGDPLSGYGRTLTTQLATMGTLLPRALWQVVVPFELSLDPAVEYRHSFVDPWVALGWGSLGGLTIGALWRGPTARLRRIGVVLTWAMAGPWVVVPLNMPLAEHRMYGPLLGLTLVAAASLPRLVAALRRVAPRPATAVACAAAVVLGVVGSAARSLQYRDERLLWQQELVYHPYSFRAWWGLGTSRRRHGDLVGAIEPLSRAHLLYPTHHDALRNYVEALASLPDEHADPYRTLSRAEALLALGPEDPWTRTLVAQAHLQAGRVLGDDEHFATAERVALSCLDVAPPKGYVYQLAALARAGRGDLHGALAHLDASIARGLDTVGVRVDRARALHELGRVGEARRELLRLQLQHPGDPNVLGALQALAAPPR